MLTRPTRSVPDPPQLQAHRVHATRRRRNEVTVATLVARLGHTGALPDAVVLGGGCAGLALTTALLERGTSAAVIESRTHDLDGRTWCYWDTGEALLPETVSNSWTRWEVRSNGTVATAADPSHPYRMVRARDYRVAARRRIEASPHGRLLDGLHVVDPPLSAPGGRGLPLLLDARGPAPTGPLPRGRVVLHQRFLGRWVRTARAVFDDSTVTLMDFVPARHAAEVRFFYVLPVAPDLALVECTVFTGSAHSRLGFGAEIDAYLHRRWGLAAGEWTVEGEETGSIVMTDAPPAAQQGMLPFGVRAGAARPSSGYAFTRIQRSAGRAADAIAVGMVPEICRDPIRTRVLDAVFLRFLRDQSHRAPDVFVRMFARLPGPLTVRFLTERSTLLDEIQLILALPKLPFLRAAAATMLERIGATAR